LLDSARDGYEKLHAPTAVPTGKELRHMLNKMLICPQKCRGRFMVEKPLALSEFETRNVQSLAGRYIV